MLNDACGDFRLGYKHDMEGNICIITISNQRVNLDLRAQGCIVDVVPPFTSVRPHQEHPEHS